MRKCREISHLVLEGEDRPLKLSERLALRVHLMMCTNCTRFVQQVALMRQAMTRWRRYRDEAGE
jgi:hypothetical protein